MMEIVAEVGPCNGRIEDAMSYVDACAVLDITMKVQWYDRDRLVTPSAPRYDQTDSREISQYQMFEETLTWDEWEEVFEYAAQVGVDIFPSVFDIESIMVAEAMGIKRLKIASADITYLGLIETAARVADELIVSTGGATHEEVIEAIHAAEEAQSLTLLACHLGYPSRLSEANLGRLTTLHQFADLERAPKPYKMGYSDHVKDNTTAHLPMLVALGAEMWERHFTLTPGNGGDHNMAITQDGMKAAIVEIRKAMEIMGDGVLRPTKHERQAVILARRSIVAATDIPRGTHLTGDMLKVVRPGHGIQPKFLVNLIERGGQIAMVDIEADTVLEWPMVGHVGGTLSVE